MNAILLDINVFLDYFLSRDGFDDAREIINNCVRGEIKGCVSAHEITTLSYYLEKGIGDRSKITSIISKILRVFTVIETNDAILAKALFSDIRDYEDAVIEAAALENNVDYIITKNVKDFEESKIKALLPKTYLKLLEL